MAEELNWGDGNYERTARTLEPAAEVALDTAEIAPGERDSMSPVGPATPPWPPHSGALEQSGSTPLRRW
ncbi:hypothetical protein BH24ACT24_BH24ACT24_10890 [soil metagenome]